MGRQSVWWRVFCSLMLVTLALLTGTAGAQTDTWPPVQVQTTSTVVDGLVRHDIYVKNVSSGDLADVTVVETLPPAVAFNRFESVSFATTQFDGKDVMFVLIKLPAGQTLGPLSYYFDPKAAKPDVLKTKIFVQWRGASSGSLVVPDVTLEAGKPEGPSEAIQAEIPSSPQLPIPATAEMTPVPPPATPASFELWNVVNRLKSHKWVDLTHTFAPGIPRWPGFPDAKFTTIFDYDKDGFFAQEFIHVGQYGTHMDPPGHFIKGMRLIDGIDVKEMVAPLVVINVADKVAANPDYELTVNDIKVWEAQYGPVPAGAFVAMRSDWSKRWPDPRAFENKDAKGHAHYPGWTLEALKYLYETRKVLATGHEPADTDAAVAQDTTGFQCETYILKSNHYQIELMANLDQVPEAGAIIFATVPKPKDGSGFPARVFAILP